MLPAPAGALLKTPTEALPEIVSPSSVAATRVLLFPIMRKRMPTWRLSCTRLSTITTRAIASAPGCTSTPPLAAVEALPFPDTSLLSMDKVAADEGWNAIA